MNLGKAREHFSAFYEGTLDRGLRQGFERVLREDAQAQAEYRAFERTMQHLESLKTKEIGVPDDLHERIMARIDRHAWEVKQKPKTTFSWWKIALPIGVAASILTLSIAPWKTPETSGASFVPTQSSKAKLDVKAASNGVAISYPKVAERDIVIRDSKGEILEKIQLRAQGISDKVLQNDGEAAILLSIDESDMGTTWIAVPGSASAAGSAGRGALKELALALASTYKLPVVLQVKDASRELSWTLDEGDAHGSASKAVEALGLKVELRGDAGNVRTLWILGS